METLNKKNLSFPAKVFTQVFATLGLILTLAACGNKGGGNNNVPVVPPIYGGGCQNCAASIPSPVLLTQFNTASADGNVSLVNMQMYAQSTGVTSMVSGNNYKGYSGPVAMQGTLVVKAPQYDYVPYTTTPASACVLPAGTYTLQTIQVGQMGLEGVNLFMPKIISTLGGIELKIEAASPMGFLTSQSLWATVTVERVNGISCSQHFKGDFE